MKKGNKIITFPAIILLVLSLFTGGFLTGVSYQSKLDRRDECGVSDKIHIVKIEKNAFQPASVKAKRCDKLTFYNNDDKLHGVAFGTMEKHQPYGEFAQEYLQPKERITIKLNKSGSYEFHDHLKEEIHGQISIRE